MTVGVTILWGKKFFNNFVSRNIVLRDWNGCIFNSVLTVKLTLPFMIV